MVFWDGMVEKVKERRQLARNTKSNRSNVGVMGQLRAHKRQTLRDDVLADTADTYINYSKIKDHLEGVQRPASLHDVLCASGIIASVAMDPTTVVSSEGGSSPEDDSLSNARSPKKNTVTFHQQVQVFQYFPEDEDAISPHQLQQAREKVNPCFDDLESESHMQKTIHRLVSPTKGFWMSEATTVEFDDLDEEAAGEMSPAS